MPVLLLLTLTAIDFGRVFLGWVNLQQMTRIAANYAAEHASVWAVPGPADPTGEKAEYRAKVGNDAAPDQLHTAEPTAGPGPGRRNGSRVTRDRGAELPVRHHHADHLQHHRRDDPGQRRDHLSGQGGGRRDGPGRRRADHPGPRCEVHRIPTVGLGSVARGDIHERIDRYSDQSVVGLQHGPRWHRHRHCQPAFVHDSGNADRDVRMHGCRRGYLHVRRVPRRSPTPAATIRRSSRRLHHRHGAARPACAGR